MYPARLLIAILLLSPLLWLAACNSTPDDTAQKIAGRWDVIKATRNGRETNLLQEGFFEFKPTGEVTFNLDGVPQTARYELDHKKISISGSSMDTEYTLRQLEANTMVLDASLQGFEFQFTLTRSQ
jgi:hypothetical protein